MILPVLTDPEETHMYLRKKDVHGNIVKAKKPKITQCPATGEQIKKHEFFGTPLQLLKEMVQSYLNKAGWISKTYC